MPQFLYTWLKKDILYFKGKKDLVDRFCLSFL